MTHKDIVDSVLQLFVFVFGSEGLDFLPQLSGKEVRINIFCAISNDVDYLFLVRRHQFLTHFEHCFKDIEVTTRIPSHLVHEQIDEDDIRDDYAEETHLFFKYFFLFAAFDGVESFGVDEVEVVDVL